MRKAILVSSSLSFLVACSVLAAHGCALPEDESHGAEYSDLWYPLIGIEEWQQTEQGLPQALTALGEEECAIGSVALEDNSLEVNTTHCPFVSFQYPLPERLEKGDRLRWRHWHLDLWAPQAATGVVQLYLGETLAHESTYAIPGKADFTEAILLLVETLDEGTPITFHVHNHGLNSWRFGPLEKEE